MKERVKMGQGFLAYLKYVWREKNSIYWMGLLFIPTYIAANYLQVYLPKLVVMELEEERSIPYLGISILGLILILIVCIFFRVKMLAGIEFGNRMIIRKMQNDFVRKLLYVDYKYLEDKEFLSLRNKTKESLLGGTIDSWGRAQMSDFTKTLFAALASGGNILLYIYYLCLLSPWLTVVLLFLMTVAILLHHKVLGEYEERYAKKGSDVWQKLDYVTRKTEDFTMAKDVRIYRMDIWLSGLAEKFCAERLFFKAKEMRSRALVTAVYVLCFGLYYFCFFISILLHLRDGSISVSDVVFYAGMGPALYHLIDLEFIDKITYLFRISIEFNRFHECLGYGENTGDSEVPVKKAPPVIELEHVSFSYPGAGEEVLKDFNLSVKRGEKIAIVGVNGAGKTTLMKLICGLLHPVSGRILLNGRDMEEMGAEERYAWFSCAFQDIQFLPLSIRENISMEVSDASDDDRIWKCLEQAGIRQDIEGLPKQLNTAMEKNINEDALEFSGGQRQKLILARALYRDAGTLILDEPTAALDALAEHEIYERYAEFAKNKTSFFVSHRLSSTRFCDRILLLDGGNVAEEGTHEELLAAGGLYAEMFALQSKYYKGGEES